MGIIYAEAIRDYDFNLSNEIGRASGRSQVTITEVFLDPTVKGGVAYGREIPGTFGTIDHHITYRQTGVSTSRTEGRFRVEAQVAKESGNPFEAGDRIVFAREAASKWVTHKPLKNPNKNKKDPNDLDPVTDFEQVLAEIENWTCDPWETGQYLTAGLSVPPKLYDDDVQNYSRGDWYLSCCKDFDQCWDELYKSDPVVELLELTNRKKIAIGPKQLPTDHKYKRLCDEAAAEANPLIFISIRQALAGVSRDLPTNVTPALEPVFNTVDSLYRNHLYNLNKKCRDRETDSFTE
jgi:hypothetical protein